MYIVGQAYGVHKCLQRRRVWLQPPQSRRCASPWACMAVWLCTAWALHAPAVPRTCFRDGWWLSGECVSSGPSRARFMPSVVCVRCTRGAYTGIVVWTASANLEATCCRRLCFCPKLYLTLQKELGQCTPPPPLSKQEAPKGGGVG